MATIYGFIPPQDGKDQKEGLCMIQKSDCLTLGYDWDKWYDFGVKEPISVDISSSAKLNLEAVPANEIILKPELLK